MNPVEAASPSSSVPSSLPHLLNLCQPNPGRWPQSGIYPCLFVVYICKSLQRTGFTFQEKQTPAESDRSLHHQDGGKSRLRSAPPGGLPPFSLDSLLPVSGQRLLWGRHLVSRLLVPHQDRGFSFSIISTSFKHQPFFFKYLLGNLKKKKSLRAYEKSPQTFPLTHTHTQTTQTQSGPHRHDEGNFFPLLLLWPLCTCLIL